MKKLSTSPWRIITIALALVFTNFYVSAQEFAPIGATWHYEYNHFSVGGYVKLEVTSDTLINDKSYRKIEKWFDVISYDPDTQLTYLDKSFFVRSANDSIFAYLNGEEILLYRFNVQAGDTWETKGDPDQSDCDSTALITVSAVGVEVINGKNLKYIETTVSNQPWMYPTRIYELMGHLNYLLAEPIVFCNTELDEASGFRCYTDGYLGQYKPNSKDCDYVTGISVIAKESKLTVHPNPAQDIIKISGPKVIDVTILSSDGRQILVSPFTQDHIDIRDLTPGIYFVKAITSSGSLLCKFVKL